MLSVLTGTLGVFVLAHSLSNGPKGDDFQLGQLRRHLLNHHFPDSPESAQSLRAFLGDV